jgi:ribosomal protein S18 acetylase RimI-like enzyme
VAHGLTVEAPAIELRPAEPGDREFLLAVYASTRAEELSVVPWTNEEKAAFLRMQFEAQDAHYRTTHPDGRFDVIVRGATPIGRMYVANVAHEIRIIDIALLPEYRGQGVGSDLIARVLAEADAEGLPVTLHVEPWNPARRLYERFGFHTVSVGDVYELMERPASVS